MLSTTVKKHGEIHVDIVLITATDNRVYRICGIWVGTDISISIVSGFIVNLYSMHGLGHQEHRRRSPESKTLQRL